MTLATGARVGPYEIEPLCGRERRGSPQAKSRVLPRAERGISC
jgi:hypothetical protein